MSNVLFAIPRTVYGSYSDHYRLIELAGYGKVYIDEIDPDSTNTYIMTVSNSENANGWQSPRARIILWDLEWRFDAPVSIPGLSEYWHMDAWTARRIGARYVPVGGDSRLYEDAPAHGLYNVAYLGYMIPRRQQVLTWLQGYGLQVSPTSAWGPERATVLRNSIAYLHVHQWDHAPGVPALRMVVAAAYKLPVVTETFADEGIFRGTTLQSDYWNLGAFANLWTRNPSDHLDVHGEALHDLLCERYTFRKGIEAAL